MEKYCLRITDPEVYQGWWIVDSAHFSGTSVPVSFGYVAAIHPDGAALSSWSGDKLIEVKNDAESAGFSVMEILLESAKQYMLR